jgi:hypothetical protein
MNGDLPDLGPCCMCGAPRPYAIVMLKRRAAVRGHGWGCVVCGLPADGAVAVLCDPCFERYHRDPAALTLACAGYPSRGRPRRHRRPAARRVRPRHDAARLVMSSAKPILGYPSYSAAVVALRAAGLPTAAIAARLGIKHASVTAFEHSAGRRKHRPAEAKGRTVLFPVDVLAALGPHAARRNIHPNCLARLIVETVVDEGMIDAVLDDGCAAHQEGAENHG